MKTLSSVIILVLLSTACFCQGFLRDVNESGFGLNGQFTSIENGSLVGFSGIYTVDGKLDLSLGLGFENSDLLTETGTTITPSISYLVLKQFENDAPVSIALRGAYSYTTFGDLDLTGNGFSVGSVLYYTAELSSNTDIVPAFSLGWRKVSLESNGFDLGNVSDVFYQLGATLTIQDFYVNPFLTFIDGDSQFSTVIGYLF